MSSLRLLLILSFLLSLASISLAIQDPELEQCMYKCTEQSQFDESEVHECKERCKGYYREKQRREREEKERDPKGTFKRLRECEGKCLQKNPHEHEWKRCDRKCHEEFTKEVGGTKSRYEGGEKEEKFEREREGEPYVFQDKHFSTKLQSDHGKLRILQRFDERSQLLHAIGDYRVMIFEADPQTFIVPNHYDADMVLFVYRGRGTISLIHQDKRESFNIRHGDVLRIEAGTIIYTVNSDNNEKLVMVELMQPVSTPGQFEAFFGPGGNNPESFFMAFSPELLLAAFNTRRDKFEKVFQQQRGVIIKASEEQIREMTPKEEGAIWPFGSKSKGPYNLFKKRPSQSNQHGQFYHVNPRESRDLRELDVGVAFINITRNSTMAPMYNSRATMIAVVVSGEGYLEIACSHLSSSSYQRVSANLRRGTVYVIPAGHPFITVASQNENLQVVCFDVKAENNKKFQLAGMRNIFNQFEKEAKELAFGVSEREVDEVFKSQIEEFFFRGPRQQHGNSVYY